MEEHPAMPPAHIDQTAVLDSLYEAALQPELLPQALQDYARPLNGTVGVMLRLVDHQGRVIVSRDGLAAAQASAQRWWKRAFLLSVVTSGR
jgi:hypothetical protein